MSRTYVAPGDVITWTNGTGSAVVSGELVAIGNVIGVALGAIANGAAGEVAIEGVHEVAKVSTADCLVGTLLQLDVSQTPDAMEDAAATAATGDITGGALCVEAAGTSATKVKVKLLPGSGAVT
jgi:predicted RecA/RadA family phage recombinase